MEENEEFTQLIHILTSWINWNLNLRTFLTGNHQHVDLHRDMVELAKEHSSGQKQDMLTKLFNTKEVSVKPWRYFRFYTFTLMEPIVISLCKALKANLKNSLKLRRQWQWRRPGGGWPLSLPLVSCQGVDYRPLFFIQNTWRWGNLAAINLSHKRGSCCKETRA